MIKSKKLLTETSVKVKKEKKKFNKNSSFSGVESKKSPKSRRKSIASVLPTPLKKTKKENTSSEWMVSESGSKDTPAKGKQLLITDSVEDETVEKNKSLLKTPKMKKKQSESAVSVSGKKKNMEKSSSWAKQIVCKAKEALKEPNNASNGNEIELEQKFGIEASNIAKAVNTVIKLHRENPKLQNQLFDDPFQISLQVCCHKVPRGPSRIIRIPLPNPILTPDDEVCLIVPELKGVKNIEHEKHIEHYEDLLRTKGVENIKKIMTFHEFRTEHETFEQMSRLVDLYDAFLVDGKISGKVVKKCGKIFYKKRKVPTSVKLQATKLKEHIDKALSKAFFLLHLKGDSYSVKFGHDKMQTQDLVDNVFAIIERLNLEFPGGFENIKGLHISTTRATSIPIYSSFKIPKEVTIPTVKSKKPKGYKTYKGELTTLPNAEVVVKPTGQVIVKRTKKEEDNVANESKQSKGKKQKTKKRKLSENGSVEVTHNVDIESEENDKKMKKTKKRKQLENVSVDNNNEGTPETNSNENDIKKKKIKKVKNVEKQKIHGADQTPNLKKKSIKKKTKVVVDIKNKEKKNKKKIKIQH